MRVWVRGSSLGAAVRRQLRTAPEPGGLDRAGSGVPSFCTALLAQRSGVGETRADPLRCTSACQFTFGLKLMMCFQHALALQGMHRYVF